jgi:hypothetical protein
MTLTATIEPSPGDSGTVTFRDNGFIIAGGGDIPVVADMAVFTTRNLTVGHHSLTAEYSGTPHFAAGVSDAANIAVFAPPRVVSVTPNGNIPSLAGAQRLPAPIYCELAFRDVRMLYRKLASFRRRQGAGGVGESFAGPAQITASRPIPFSVLSIPVF